MLSNLNLVSLDGLNNLRKLQYAIDGSQISKIYDQLRTVSSSLISEVDFKCRPMRENDGHYKHWNYIDHLMIQSFPALLIVTITWIPNLPGIITWNDCVSRSVKALPKLHQKGILRPLLPPPRKLK